MIKPEDDIFFTRTMAEILEKQGHIEDALTIYRILFESAPEDSELETKIRELEQRGKRRRP